MPHVDREGTPEHTTHFESCGCSEAREAALRAECERQRGLLNTAVVKLDSCYQDYKKYRNLSEEQAARIVELEAVLETVPHSEDCRTYTAGVEGRLDGPCIAYRDGLRQAQLVCAGCRLAAALKGAAG